MCYWIVFTYSYLKHIKPIKYVENMSGDLFRRFLVSTFASASALGSALT